MFPEKTLNRRPTQYDVAKRAGVSQATVSIIINNSSTISIPDETRKRVLDIVEEIGYHPNALARSLRSGETHTIGLILPDSSNPYFAEMGHVIESEAFERGYSIVLCNTENDQNKERLYTEVLERKQVDGMIFVAAGDQTGSLKALIQKKMLVILVDRDFPNLNVDAVISDNYLGGHLATQYLVQLKHKRIACITGPSNINSSAKRVTGYQAALTESGIKLDQNLIVRGDFHPESGRLAALNLLKLPNRPTAIFACNDLMAVGVLRAAAELGLRVPEDLAVIGYDDIELASYTNPPLTTIKQPKLEIGRTVMEILVNRIKNKQSTRFFSSLPVSLVVRGSC